MRLIDSDRLKRYKVRIVQGDKTCDAIVVYDYDIDKMRTYFPKDKVITSDNNTVKIDWLYKKLVDLVYKREIDGSVLRIIQRLCGEWEKENVKY